MHTPRTGPARRLRLFGTAVALGLLLSLAIPAPAGAAVAGVDMAITYPKEARSVGVGIHSSDGSGQTMSITAKRRTKETFTVGCANDGTGIDGIKLKATTPARGFKVTYTFYSGTVDITDDVTGSGYVLPDQAAGASWGVVMYVKATRAAPRHAKWLITGTSTMHPTTGDTVGMKVRLKN